MGRDLELLKLKLELELDKDGSLVGIEPRGWYIRVLPGRVKHWRHPFVHQRHKHVFVMRPVGPAQWPLFDPWWYRLLTATITSEQTRKVLTWARGNVQHVRGAVPGRGSHVRGSMSCAAVASYLLGRKYWVAAASRVIAACEECTPSGPKRRCGAPKAGPHEMRPVPRAWGGGARTRVCGQFRHDDLPGAPGTEPLRAQLSVYVDLLPRCNAACPCRAGAHELAGNEK